MARIEYLINNPYEVELSDLELLDAEIEKYPYFYSLRAIKLLAFKKFNHQDFEKELQLTTVLNSNPEELYQFLHPEEFKVQTLTIETEIPEENQQNSEDLNIIENEIQEPISDSELIENIIEEEIIIPEAVEEISTDESDSISPKNDIIEENNVETIVITEDSIQEIDTILSQEVNLENAEKTIIEISENKIIDNPISEELELSIIQDELEKEFLDQITDSTEENYDLIEVIETTYLENHSEEINNELATESSILIENNLVREENIPTEIGVNVSTEETLVIDSSESNLISNETDLDSINFSIENSIEVANDFLEKDTMIAKAVEETMEIYEMPIEQVDLVNRSEEFVQNITDFTPTEPVSTFNSFQILNTKNEIIGGFGFEETIVTDNSFIEEEIVNELVEPELLPTIEEPIIVEIEDSDPIIIQEIKEDKLPEVEETIIVENNSESNSTKQGDSFSFNEWLKIPLHNQETSSSSEKEMKFQIIEEFLDKNPKIKPLKKIEVPEHKAEVRDIKQTDFSDLMTETLAQIYIEQKQYEKAIRAYKILSLKYPEKNSLFAKQIKEIENLKNSK